MDATGCAGRAQAAAPGSVPWCPAATMLLGIPGPGRDGGGAGAMTAGLVVDVVTAPDLEEPARRCPDCGSRGRGQGLGHHRAARRSPRRPADPAAVAEKALDLRQRGCPRETFTESLPAVPPRARLTARLRTRIGEAIGDDLMPAAAAARRYRVSDRTAAAAFTAYADAQLADLDEHQDPVEAAGIDEFRRGIPGPADGQGQARSEWFTHLVDLGTGGTLGLAQGRTAEAGKGLLDSHAAKLRYLAMDLSAPYRAAAPAGVTVIADAFHLVKLANRKIDDAFRRLGYRTEHPHEDIGLPRPLHYMLRYNIENLNADHLDTIIDTLDGDGDGQQIAASGSRKSTSAPCSPSAPRKRTSPPRPAPSATSSPPSTSGARTTHDIPEIKTLANTIGKWQQPVIDAVLTGYSNAKAEAHNRTAKWSPGLPADLPTPTTRPAVSAWPPPAAARLGPRRPAAPAVTGS